jgi:hypothetical protein
MLETSYTLNLGQLFKIAPNFKKYVWPRLKLDKPWEPTKPTTDKTPTFVVLNISTRLVAIDNHMIVIQVQIGKNIINDVLLNGQNHLKTIES